MAERETPLRTLAVAGGVALFCSLLVASAVQLLRPMQLAHEQLARNRAIVAAAGLISATSNASDLEVVAAFVGLEQRLYDIVEARFTTDIDPLSYDYRAAVNDVEATLPLPAERDAAGIGRLARYLPIYISIEADAAPVVIVPVYGRGMWSTIYGQLALTGDLDTIAGLSFYEHGETPGIGDRIENPEWLSQWRGKHALGSDREVLIRLASAALGAAPESSVDAITGATVTATAVERLVRFWLGPDGYGEALRQLAAEFRALEQ